MDTLAVVYPDNLAALGVCRSLGRRGIPVSVLAGDRAAPAQYSRYARRVPCPPLGQEDEFIAFLVKFARAQRQRPVLFLTDDMSLVTISRHRRLLDEYYRFPHSDWPVLRDVLYKDRLYAALDGVVPVPRTLLLEHDADVERAGREIGYPALVKPLLRCLPPEDGTLPVPFEKAFGAKAVRVADVAALAGVNTAARALGFTLLVQEEIPGPISALSSVALYAGRDTVMATFTSHKLAQVPPDFGDGLVVEATAAPDIVPLAIRAVGRFAFRGMAEIEFKWDSREGVHKLLDINPRPWLWINLPATCGVDIAHAAYLDALHRPLVRSAFVQRDFQTRWVSMRGIAVTLVRSLVQGRPAAGLLSVLRQARGPRVGPLFSRDDVLLRMFLSPGYWRDSLRSAAHGVAQLRATPAERCT